MHDLTKDSAQNVSHEIVSDDKLQALSQQAEEKLSSEEKFELKSDILTSIRRQKIRRISTWSSAAAAIIILIGSTFLLQHYMKADGIVAYAHKFEATSTDGNTHLFLGMNDAVEIDTDESEIQHLKNSSEIRIDTEESVEQELKTKKTIYNTLCVPFGKRTKIVLADNSTIWLNSGSKFIYPAKFADDKREVYLEGEAVFEVTKNKEKPFHVITNDVEVKVLGTVFNVSAYPNDDFTSTALVSGSVELNYRESIFGSETLRIKPGTVAVFNKENDTMAEQQENVERYTSWRYGILMLEAEQLKNIANKLSRFHNIEIEITDNDLACETFSGQLDYKQSAEQALRVISEIVDFELTANADKITIFKRQ